MSREQVTEQTQSDANQAYAARDGDIDGLPPYLHGLVMQVRPGDAAALVTLLRGNLPYAERILAAASPHVGLSTIKQAQAMMPGNTVVVPGGSLGAVRPGTEYLDETPAEAPTQSTDPMSEAQHMEDLAGMDGGVSLALPEPVAARLAAIRTGDAQALCDLLVEHPELSDALCIRARNFLGLDTLTKAIALKDSRAAKPNAGDSDDKTTAKQDDKWASGAQAYNASHAQWVSKFIDIMKDPSFVGPDGQIDPRKVAAFQSAQGIDADGRVGPKTVAAAQKYMDAHPDNFGLE